MPFSDIRFLQRAPLLQARRRRIREWLLLALRIAALLLLALAFARPFFDATGLAGRPVTIVALDRSFSMSQPGRFERARGEARAAIAEAPPGDLVGLVTFDERARVVAEPAADRAAAVAALDRAAPGFGATRYAAALAAAARSIGSRDGRIVVVTDLQRAGWQAAGAGTVPPGVTVRMVDLGAGRPQPRGHGARDRPGARRGRGDEHGRAAAVEHGRVARRRGCGGCRGGHAGAWCDHRGLRCSAPGRGRARGGRRRSRRPAGGRPPLSPARPAGTACDRVRDGRRQRGGRRLLPGTGAAGRRRRQRVRRPSARTIRNLHNRAGWRRRRPAARNRGARAVSAGAVGGARGNWRWTADRGGSSAGPRPGRAVPRHGLGATRWRRPAARVR